MNTCTYDAFGRGAHVSSHDNLKKMKSIVDLCFLVGSHVDWKTFQMSSHVKVIGQDRGHISDGPREVYDFLLRVAVSEIPSLTASSFTGVTGIGGHGLTTPPDRSGLTSSSHHMEKTEAGLKGLCIREIMTKYTLYYTKYYTIVNYQGLRFGG